MQVSPERQGSRDRRRNRHWQIVPIFQNYLYQHAERRAGRKRRWILEYLSVLPMLAVVILGTYVLQHLVDDFAFKAGFLTLTIAVTAFWWGWGPGLLLLFLGAIILDYFFVVPVGQWTVMTWPNVLQLFPWAFVDIIIGILSFQRDKGWVKTHTQADELALIRERLEDEAQLKDRFLSMTSHELKTPMACILMQSQLLERRAKSHPIETADLLEVLGTINEHTHYVTGMIEKLLDLSLTQSHRITLERKMFDLNELVRQVLEDQRLITGRTLLFQGSATPATMYGDRHRLTQVVSNLVSNAIKYSPASSPIEVSVEHNERLLVMQVHDHGQGIAQEHLDQIFEPFYRTPEAQSSATSGLGLGLAITKHIVDLHEGRIWCTSEEGFSCTFFVELPAKA